MLAAVIIVCMAVALILPQSVSITPMSLAPAAFALMLCIWAVLIITGRQTRFGRFSLSNSTFDFKYSKRDGEGEFVVERRKRKITKTDIAVANVFFIIAILLLPFTVFFPDSVKLLVLNGIGIILMIGALISVPVIIIGAVKANVDARRKEEAEAERQRREQINREETGKWK